MMGDVFELGAHDRMSPAELLALAQRAAERGDIKGVMVVGYADDGGPKVFYASSDMSSADIIFAVEFVKLNIMVEANEDAERHG